MFRLVKGQYIQNQRVQEIISCAKQLLSNVGIRVPDQELRNRLEKEGFVFNGKSVKLDEATIEAYLGRQRIREQSREIERTQPVKLDGLLGIYSGKMESFDNPGSVEPMTSDQLIRAAQFAEKCSVRYGISGTIPGYASDIPAPLQSLHRYMTGAKHCRIVGETEPTTPLSARYMFEMAQVLDERMDRLPIYPITPLILAGDSVYTALEGKGKINSAYVYSLPLMGVTAPLSVSMCLSLSLAETVGTAVLMEALLGIPVDIRPSANSFNMREFAPNYGTSEKLLCELTVADFYAQLFETEFRYLSTNIHSMAKVAGIQSSLEKGSLITLGAMHGAKKFYCLGTLSLDEVFSPYQLLIDIEALRSAERLVNGLPADSEPISEAYIVENMDEGFVGTDLTLDNYQDFESASFSFDHGLGNANIGAEKRLRDLVAEIDNAPVEYTLGREKAVELDRIYGCALKECN